MENKITATENIVKEQAGNSRVTVRAKVREGKANITLTSHYASMEEFRESMKRRGYEVLSVEIL